MSASRSATVGFLRGVQVGALIAGAATAAAPQINTLTWPDWAKYLTAAALIAGAANSFVAYRGHMRKVAADAGT